MFFQQLFQESQISDIEKMVLCSHTGEVSFKFGFEDHPSVFIELGSKILIANYIKPNMKEFFIDGVFKLSPSLQLMILGVPLRGLLSSI